MGSVAGVDDVVMQDYNASMISLGEKILKQRNKAGLTQEQLAQKSKITVSTIYKIEKNKINPSFQVLVNIADALNISVDELR